MSIDHSTLTKGQVRKLNALRKSVGDDIAEDAFSKWMKSQSQTPKEVRDPVADALVAALDQFKDDKTFRLGAKGYVVKRSKGKVRQGSLFRRSPEQTSSGPTNTHHRPMQNGRRWVQLEVVQSPPMWILREYENTVDMFIGGVYLIT